jgi:aspartate/methionine/tyrosine aminotransferase
MVKPPRYLAWAIAKRGQIRHDICTSGIRSFEWSEIGTTPGFDDVGSLDALRDEIARFIGVAPSRVTPALGTSHALWLAYAAVASPGDEVIVESPVYDPLVAAAEAHGARVVYTERKAERGFAVDVDDVRARFTDKTRAVVVSTLHNPSGARVPDETLRALASLCAERGAHLIVDEVYAPFDTLLAQAGGGAKWPNSACHLADNVIAVASLTKVFGAGPHRIGWLVASDEIAERARGAVLTNLGHFPFSHSSIGCTVLGAMPKLAERTRRELGNKRERVAAFMRAHPDWRYSAPDAGLFGFAWNPARPDLASEIESWHAHTGALVVPGAFFGIPTGFRVGWSLPENELDAALEKLSELLAPR